MVLTLEAESPIEMEARVHKIYRELPRHTILASSVAKWRAVVRNIDLNHEGKAYKLAAEKCAFCYHCDNNFSKCLVPVRLCDTCRVDVRSGLYSKLRLWDCTPDTIPLMREMFLELKKEYKKERVKKRIEKKKQQELLTSRSTEVSEMPNGRDVGK